MKRIRTLLTEQRGVAGMTVAISLTALIGMAAITLDIGRAFVTRSELQNIADSSALAAAGRLGFVYQDIATANNNLPTSDVMLSGSQEGEITLVADSMANVHSAGGHSFITLATNDMTIGRFDIPSETVTAGVTNADAVSIRVRRDGTQNGPLATTFANIFGISDMGLTATATAALGPATSAPPGGMTAPFGISEEWFRNGGQCNDAIKFSPTGDLNGCAGWHVYDEIQQGANPNNPTHCQGGGGGGGGNGPGGANAQLLRGIIDCLEAGNYKSPPVTPGHTQFDFTGGEVATAFNNLDNLYNTQKDSNGEWDITIPIYESTDCGNPTGLRTIVGFARAVVTGIDVQGKIIDARVECHAIIPDAPSGPPGSGLGGGMSPMGSIPGLVS